MKVLNSLFLRTISLVTLFFCSCKETRIKATGDIYEAYYDYNFRMDPSKQICRVSSLRILENDSGALYVYNYGNSSCVVYHLNLNKRLPSAIYKNAKVDSLFYKNDTLVNINGHDFRIYQFIRDADSRDGSGLYYYTAGYGIFTHFSGTWPSICTYHTNDSLADNLIYRLIHSTVDSFYLRGNLKEQIDNALISASYLSN